MSAAKASQASQAIKTAIKAFITAPSKYESNKNLCKWFLMQTSKNAYPLGLGEAYHYSYQVNCTDTFHNAHTAYKLHAIMQCLGNPDMLLNTLNIDRSMLESYKDTLIESFSISHLKLLLSSFNIDRSYLNKLSHLLLNIDRMLYDYDNDML